MSGYDYKSYDKCVRAVRGEQFGTLENSEINGNSTVTDTDTGLMWQQDVSDIRIAWEQALLNCEGLTGC